METAAAARMAHMVAAMKAATMEAAGHMERVIATAAMKSAAMEAAAVEAAESARLRRTDNAHRCRE
jgi:hypothetical protein